MNLIEFDISHSGSIKRILKARLETLASEGEVGADFNPA
jgi:hypothetical protein